MRYFTYQVPLGPKKVRGHCCEVKQLWGLAARFALESWGVLDLVVLKTGQLTGSSLWGRAPLQYRSGSAEKQISCDAANLILILVLVASLHRTCFSRQSRWIVTRYCTCRTLPFLFFCSFTRLFIQSDVVTVLCWWPGQVSADRQWLNVHFYGFFFTHVITLLYSYACYCV